MACRAQGLEFPALQKSQKAIIKVTKAPIAHSPLSSETITSLWISVAAEAGWQVIRTTDAYASSDGAGRILIGVDEVLDQDDAPAQLIFHELCHALTQGPASWSQPDWGLSNMDTRDVVAEHACLCVHVLLTTPFGLRAALAPTTEYRAYHDALDAAALAVSEEEAAVRARGALAFSGNAGLRDGLVRGLAATRAALDREQVLRGGAKLEEIETGGSRDLDAGRHPAGFAWGRPERSCGTCAWFYRGGRGPAVGRCRQSSGGEGDGQRTESETRACERCEAPVDCQACGACCREAYHSVTVSVRDPVVWKQPELIVRHGHRFEIRREGPRCAALEDRRGTPSAPPPVFSCTIYDDRPRACRDFEANGRHCLVARRRVGLSP
jgi:hypothetical protein